MITHKLIESKTPWKLPVGIRSKQLYPRSMDPLFPLKRAIQGKPVDRIRRATAELVLAQGLDAISVSAVIEKSDVSRRTFYSYYESVQAVLSEIWMLHGFDWINSLCSTPAEATGDASNDFDLLMAYSLLVSHRIEELREIITEDISQIWNSFQNKPLEQVRWVWLVGIRIGHEAQKRSGIGPSETVIFDLLNLLRTVSFEDVKVGPEIEPPVYPNVLITDEDPTTMRVLNATVDVVGKSGATKTNILRVCRKAKVSAGAIAGRFANPESMVAVAFERILAVVLEQNLRNYDVYDGVTLDRRYAASVRSGLYTSRANWRKFRREIVIAAWHNPEIRKQAVASLELSDLPLHKYIAGVSLSKEAQKAAIGFNRELSEGFSILLDLGVPVDSLSHLVPTRLTLGWLASMK